MTGFVGTKFAESFGIVTDYVDPELTELIQVKSHENEFRRTSDSYKIQSHMNDACLDETRHDGSMVPIRSRSCD